MKQDWEWEWEGEIMKYPGACDGTINAPRIKDMHYEVIKKNEMEPE